MIAVFLNESPELPSTDAANIQSFHGLTPAAVLVILQEKQTENSCQKNCLALFCIRFLLSII